jgi:hypothetical protein
MLGGLAAGIQFPMAFRVPIGGIENWMIKKRLSHGGTIAQNDPEGKSAGYNGYARRNFYLFILGAFLAQSAKNRAIRSNSSESADALSCGISASIPCALAAGSLPPETRSSPCL